MFSNIMSPPRLSPPFPSFGLIQQLFDLLSRILLLSLLPAQFIQLHFPSPLFKQKIECVMNSDSDFWKCLEREMCSNQIRPLRLTDGFYSAEKLSLSSSPQREPS